MYTKLFILQYKNYKNVLILVYSVVGHTVNTIRHLLY